MGPSAISILLHHATALRVMPMAPALRRGDAIWRASCFMRAARLLRERPADHADALAWAAMARRIAGTA